MVSFELNDEPIGTIRIVPIGYGLTLTEALLEHSPGLAHMEAAGCWEVGRLVLAPEYRTDVGTLRHCLFLALCHATRTAQITRLYAACTHVLSRLYRRFGFTAFAREVPLKGTDKIYTMIRGEGHDVLEALSGANLQADHRNVA